MFKTLILAIFIGGFIFTTPAKTFSETPWIKIDYSHLGASPQNRRDYIIFDNIVCRNDNLESLLCFDYGWRNACFELFAAFQLTENIPYVFPEYSVPILQVDGKNKIDINPVIKLEPKTGPIIPRAWDEDHAFWRVEVGDLETLLTHEAGLLYQLLNGQKIQIFFELQNGTVMRSNTTLLGIKPLLEEMIEKARAAKPEGQECSG